MASIELYLWSRCGHDGDGYESDYMISDDDYSAIVDLIVEHCAGGQLNGSGFTYDVLQYKLPELYAELEIETTEEIRSSLIESAEDWFDEETEECTIEEYIDNYYSWGFYISDNFISEVLADK